MEVEKGEDPSLSQLPLECAVSVPVLLPFSLFPFRDVVLLITALFFRNKISSSFR